MNANQPSDKPAMPELPSEAAVQCSALLADLARCLVWMEHVNRVAEREEKLGGWLSNHTTNMQEWDLEYQAIRKQITQSANSEVRHSAGKTECDQK